MYHYTSTSNLSTQQSSAALIGKISLGTSFPLKMLSAVISSILSYWALQLALQPIHHRYVHSGPLVLGAGPLNFRTLMADRNRPVSQRSEPSSRTALIGEQPNPWELLRPQDAMSRHRGAKQFRRYELLGIISLLPPAYLLSVERWPFHSEPPDH